MMKKILSLLSVFFLTAFFQAGAGPGPQEDYITKYSGIAVAEMYRSGVPASITLAQGLLESGSGRSVLATKGNNHFGIKCHSKWKGKTIRADDDEKNECFRAYVSPDESFRDHSDFLRFNDRYKFLFDYPVTDYKSWAYGLKKAGYATDPSYAPKLIRYIEDYRLYEFDTKTVGEVYASAGKGEVLSLDDGESYPAEIPESPLKMEEATLYRPSVAEEQSFSLSRTMYAKNGVPFIYSVEGESYASIASARKLFLKEILRFNDLDHEETLLPGTVVYLEAKKKMAAKGLDKYIVGKDGEKLRDIAQRFAVREKNLIKLNGLSAGEQLREGDELLLRPVRKRFRLWKR